MLCLPLPELLNPNHGIVSALLKQEKDPLHSNH
jgi:hypothetical protein